MAKPSIFTSVSLIFLIGGALTVVLNPEAEEKVERWLSQINKQLGLDKLGEIESPNREYIQALLIVLIIITACWGNVTKCFRRSQPVSADDKSQEAKRKAKGKAPESKGKDGDVEAGRGVVDSNGSSLGGVNGVVDGLGAGVIAAFNSAGALVLKHGGQVGQQAHDSIMQVKETALEGISTVKRTANNAKQYTTETAIPKATEKVTDAIAYLKANPKVTYGISAGLLTVGCIYGLHAQGHLDLKFLEQYHISYDYTSLQDNLELGLLLALTFFVFGGKSLTAIVAKVQTKVRELAGQKPAGEGEGAADAPSEPINFKALALNLKQKIVDKVVLARDKVKFAIDSSKIFPDVMLFLAMSVIAITRKPIKSMLKVALIAVQSFAAFKLLSTSISLWSGYTYAVIVAVLVALHAFPYDPWDEEYDSGDGKYKESVKRLVQWAVALAVTLFLPAMFFGKIAPEV